MRRDIVIRSLCLALVVGGVVGCSSDESSSSGSVIKTGSVGDGYIEGAYVCHDTDSDWDCLDETYATTAADGSFILSNYDPTIDLIVQIPVGAVDNGPFADGSTTPRPFNTPVWYIYPAGAAPQNAPIFVGPLSTLVAAQIDSLPGSTVDDALNVLGTQLGVDPDELLGDYIENNTVTSSGNSLQFTAEIVGTSLSNSSTANGTDYDAVLGDLGNVLTTASGNDPSTYDTTSYATQTNGASGSVSLNYQAVSDIYTDLLNCYFGFESWGDVTNTKQHKKLCVATDADSGDEVLNYTEHYMGGGNNWILDQTQSSGFVPYQSKPVDTLIDMSNVNHATVDYSHPMRLFPAVLESHSGASAIFNSNGYRYKLIVSQADIDTLSGAVLPQGPTIGVLVDPVTFGSGDMLYKAVIIDQNRTYTVANQYDHVANTTTAGTMARDYIVYEEGSMNGAAFVEMSNTQDINAMGQLLDTDFIVEYLDSSNYVKISVVTPFSSSASSNTCHIEKIVNGQSSGIISGSYTIETHNTTPFFIVHNYSGNRDLFIGKVLSVDANTFIYGYINPAYVSHDVTETSFQIGDIMDDMMLNQSARERLLNSVNAPLTLP